MMQQIDDGRIEIELNPRERRFYDRLRSVVAGFEPGTRSGFGDVLLLLPDLTVLLMRLVRDPRVPLHAKLIAGFGAAYILSPIDLVPEIIFGPLGLIDDLLVAAAALSRLVKSVHPDVVRQHWSGKGDALDAVTRLSKVADTQVTGRITSVARRILGRSRRRA